MTRFDDQHASRHGLHVDRGAFHFPVEPLERAKARRSWLRSQSADARASGLRIIGGLIE